MKYEVIKECCIAVKEGSIVEISNEQYEVAKHCLKPIEEKPVVKKKKVEDVK